MHYQLNITHVSWYPNLNEIFNASFWTILIKEDIFFLTRVVSPVIPRAAHIFFDESKTGTAIHVVPQKTSSLSTA